jgi:glycosyltransferase involved in cell wall biosynthesis
LIWDRTQDYRCPVESPNLTVVASMRRGEYYQFSTLLTVALLQPWFLWQVLRARPRAVHAMDLDTGVVGLLSARILGVPFMYQCLDPYAASLPSGWPKLIARAVHRVENALISRSDLFVVTDLSRMPQHDGAAPRAVVELPNVPTNPVEPQPWPDGTGLVVGYIGSLVPHRSLDLLVDVVGSLADEDVRLVIGGFGTLEAELRGRSERYPNVDFLGPVPYAETLRILGQCDLLVQLGDPSHPALRWVSPNKVFEAMAMGRPILVAEGTLAAERAAGSGHGVTVRYGDAAGLSITLLALRDDVEGRAALGASGRRAFESVWAPEVWSSAVLDAYTLALGSM